MSGFAIRGWCPSAWRPMMAGDGLIVRVRPPLGRLTREQALALCDLALRFGNGMLDATNRANLQIRGVTEDGLGRLMDALVSLGLVDADREREARRNLIVAPDWTAGDETWRIASEFMERLDELPDLPGKVGFTVDAGRLPMLDGVSSDFRVERGVHGGLILRADGRHCGVAISPESAVDALLNLARWFVETGGEQAGRMRRHTAVLPDWATGDVRMASGQEPLCPVPHGLGHGFGVVFGSMRADALADLLEGTHASAMRVTPWRLLLLEDGMSIQHVGFVSETGARFLHLDACPGAPCCPQATVQTRDLARRLAPRVAGSLHVSGCAKGCARAGPANVTLIGRGGAFDLAFNGRADASPTIAGLTPDQVLQHFGAD